MPLETRHFKDELQELLDHRLNPAARLAVETHLEACAECRRELEALRWTKQFARQTYAAESAPARLPAKLEDNILKALALEDDSAQTVLPGSWWRQRRALLAYGFVLLAGVALTLTYFIFRTQFRHAPDLPSVVAQDFRAYQAEKLPLTLQTGEVKALERFFTASGLAFNTRVFDLGMMNYRLVGGRIHQLNGRPSALFVYRGPAGQSLLCQMYPGLVTELPPPTAGLRENNGIRFYLYRVNGLTAVFWQEGAVTCVLTSDIAPEEVVQLAFAKAMKI